jgi:hypothetical protein
MKLQDTKASKEIIKFLFEIRSKVQEDSLSTIDSTETSAFVDGDKVLFLLL